MMWFRSLCLLLLLAMISLCASATDVKTVDTSKDTSKKAPEAKNELPPELQGHPPVTKQTRLELIRTMQAEFGFAKRLIPKGEKGLQLTSAGEELICRRFCIASCRLGPFGSLIKPARDVALPGVTLAGAV